VKSNGVGTPGELTPPVPNVDYDKYGIGGPPSPAFSVGSTFLNNASAATQVRPQVVRVESGSKKQTSQNLIPDDDVSVHDNLLPRDSNAITIIDDTPTMEQGPFSDPPVSRQKSNSSLSAVIEEATKKSQGKKGTPFGDEHEMKE